ncbi:hypothetical protein BDV12DRAFT_191060 [Aspergillus spectabilis]
MSPSIASRVFALTGGASGMGAATARLLARHGAGAISIADNQSQNFHELKKQLNEINPSTAIRMTQLDVSSKSDVREWINSTVHAFGDLHGAANVAGKPQPSVTRKLPAILDEDEELWNQIMRVNVDGIFYCTKAEIEAMHNLPPMPRAIINVASLTSICHSPDIFAYSTSKAACVHFSTCVANDVRNGHIRVNTVSPGATDTPMMKYFLPAQSKQNETAIRKELEGRGARIMEPEHVAEAIVWLLSDESARVTGVNLVVGGNIP